MSEHNFEIGDVVTMKMSNTSLYKGTVIDSGGESITICLEGNTQLDIPFELFNTLTNITKQQNNKEQQMKEQNVKPKNIKPEDEVTITVTYHDLALVYAVIGRVFGTDSRLYDLAQEMLDPDFSKSCVIGLSLKTIDEIVRYGNYCKEFEALLFPQEPVETEQQKQIRELREQAEALQEQSKELLQKARDIEESHN